MKTRASLTAFALLAAVTAVSAERALPKGDAKEIWGPDPAKPIEERHIVIRAKPQKEVDEKTDRWLVLPLANGEKVKLYYDWESPKGALPDKELTFALWRTKEVIWHTDDGQEHSEWRTTIDSIKDGNKVLYDVGVCRVHKIPMTRGDLEIHYGYIVMDSRASKKFMGGPGWVAGGCLITEGAPSKVRGYKCERCVAAYEKWSEQERKKWERRQAKEEAASGN